MAADVPRVGEVGFIVDRPRNYRGDVAEFEMKLVIESREIRFPGSLNCD